MNGISKFNELKKIIAANQRVIASSDLATMLFKEDIMGGSKPNQLQRRFLEVLAHCRTEKGFYDLRKFDESKIVLKKSTKTTAETDNDEKVKKLFDNFCLVAEKLGYKIEAVIVDVETDEVIYSVGVENGIVE